MPGCAPPLFGTTRHVLDPRSSSCERPFQGKGALNLNLDGFCNRQHQPREDGALRYQSVLAMLHSKVWGISKENPRPQEHGLSSATRGHRDQTVVLFSLLRVVLAM